MNTRTTALTLAVATLFSTTAFARPYGHSNYSVQDYQRNAPSTDYAQVLSARPIYSEVRVNQPRQECYDQRVVYRDEYQNNRSSNAAERTIGTVLGGVIGGAVGHQFGRGSGRQIATAIGAVVGADIGRNAVNSNYSDYDRGERERVAYEPRCTTIDEARYEQRIQGYDVTYRYGGQVYNTQLPYDPGARLPVQVNVSPLRN